MKKILIVDDSPSVRQQVRAALQPAGFELVDAVDGMDALKKLTDDNFSLVVCDVNMPRMNGMEFVEKAKANPKYADLPVVMLTTEGQKTMIQRAKKAGAKGWIIKPFKPAMLVAAAKKLTAG